MVDASGHFDEELWMHPTVDLENRRLGPTLGSTIAEGLCSTDIVRILGLSGNNMSDDGVMVLIQGLKQNRSVEILDLSDNNIKDSGAIAIASILQHNTTLQSIILGNNKIRKTGAAAMADALAHNKRLKKLNMSGNRLRDAGATALVEMLRVNTTLQHVNVSRNEINVAGGKAFADVLKANTTLQALNLANNLLGEAVVEFGPALTRNSTLMELDLENNMITAEHATRLGDSLLQVSLMTVNLSNNHLGDEGTKPILDSFKERSTLRYLDISNTGITAKCMDEVAILLRLCPQMETLQVDGNKIGTEGVTVLAATIKENQSLTSLNLDKCGMDSMSTTALALALHNNPLFTSLTISGNKIGDEGCRGLCYALKRMTMLQNLDLSNNEITDAMKQELASVFVNNTRLAYIPMHGNPIAASLVNAVISRRVAFQTLEQMDNNTTVLAAATPLNATSMKRAPSILPQVRAGSPSVLKATQLSMSTDLEASAMKNALVQLAVSSHPDYDPTSSHASQITPLRTQYAMQQEDEERAKTTYPPLIPPKTSLEHPYYPSFGRGRFSNGSMIQCPGEVVPYTVANSLGPKPVAKWCDQLSTSDAMFASALRRVHKSNPYLERQLEVNVGGLLVTERQLRDAFNELDVDGNGWLDRGEFEQLFQTFENFGVQAIEKMRSNAERYKVMDDHKLTFDEFCMMMLSVAQR
jgi:Ran GTPase-activating protein (RanGAP) involved in mRNA processing and transport